MKNNNRRRIIRMGVMMCLSFALFLLVGTQRVNAEEVSKIPYLIKVNRAYNTITIYEKDKDGKYTVPVKAMACSVGTGERTIKGTFQTKAKYRWKLLMGNVYGQYSTRIVGGILFHSVYYYENGNPGTLATTQYNKLGSAASHGCIRLTVADAKWIYDNCAVGTTVIIYDNAKNPGPLGKPETIKIPTNVKWDPTDPSKDNPYKDKKPSITGTKNLTTDIGKEIDVLKGVKAKSSLGADITAALTVTGEINFKKAGKYKITYSVTDILNRTASKTITVTVKETVKEIEKIPEITGVTDRLVKGDVVIDRTFALKGVAAYGSGKKLSNKLIEVTILEISENEYAITYQLKLGSKTASATAKVSVDREAPKILNVEDFYLEEGEVPSEEFLLEGIEFTDNLTETKKLITSVSLESNEDGGYTVVYKAVDEAGNEATQEARVFY